MHGQKLSCHYHLVDVENLAAGYLAAQCRLQKAWLTLPLPPWNSDALSTAIGVDLAIFDRHTALGDARWSRAIYDQIMGTTPAPASA